MFKKYLFILSFIFCMLSILTTLEANDSFKISQNTKIYIADKSASSKEAANILQRYLHKILGKKLDILNSLNNEKDIILVGKIDKKEIQQRLKDNYPPSDDGFILEIDKDFIIITAPTNRGVIYGAYYLLEDIGCKFLSPDFEVIPKKQNLKLTTKFISSSPRFSYREIFIGESDQIDYAVKNRLNGRRGHRTLNPIPNRLGRGINVYNTFSLYKILPPKKYKKEYPNIFCNAQIDFTNQDAKRLFKEELTKKLENMRLEDKALIALPHRDNKKWCKSKDSLELINKYKTPAAPYMLYGFYLSTELEKTFPKLKFILSAYEWSRKAPTDFPDFPSNTILSFADIEADFAKPLNSSKNMQIYQDLKDWSKLSNNIYIWHYITNFDGYFIPYPDLYALDKNIKLFSKIPQIDGIFLQGSYGTYGGELSALRVWVFSKLLWDPSLNLEQLINEFVTNYYGDAAEDVLSYLRLLYKELESSNSNLHVKTSIDAKYLNDNFLQKAEDILKSALLKVKHNDIYKRHVIELLSGIDYIYIVRGADKDRRTESIKRFNKFIKNRKITHYAEGKKIKDLKPYLKYPKKIAKIPEMAKGKLYKEFQEYAFKLCCTKIKYDKSASDNIAATIKGDRSDWAFQLPLDSLEAGKWDIYIQTKITLKNPISIQDNMRFALFYGIKGASIKNGTFLYTLKDQKYHTLKIATITIKSGKRYLLWIRPPANNIVKKLYIDRAFAIKHH